MLNHITIDNFKSFDHFEMDMPQFSVIVGNNGVGKSNLLKAIKMISLLAAGNSIKDVFIELELVNKEIFFNSDSPKFSITLDIELNGIPIKYLLEITMSNEPEGNFSYKVTKESLNNGKPIFHREGDKIIIDTDEGSPTSNVEIVNSRILLSILTKPKIVSEVQNFLTRMKIDIYELSKLRNPGSVSNIAPGLNKNLTETLFALKNSTPPEKYKEIEREAKEMIMGLEDISVDETGGNLVISFRESSFEKRFSVFSSSDGNLRLLGILTSILGEPKPSVVFIDELENSMHPKRIKALMKFLNYLSGREVGGMQIVFTTHSPIVLKFVDERAIIYMFKINGKTVIAKPHSDKKIFGYLAKAKDEDTDIGDLFMSGALEDIYKLGIEVDERST